MRGTAKQPIMTNRLYVAATSQHVGKTTSTLGLTAAIQHSGYHVGYCKPVGQQFVDLGDLRVDKDALLFADIMKFDLRAEWHSPVIIGRGVTSAYLDNPSQFNFREAIEFASQALHSQYDFVVYEGTGHPGVGSVVDLSNAQVAQMLGAPVVMIVEGGIGNTIDTLNMNTALFRERKVPVVGVILNKVIPEKIEKVERYVGKYLQKMGIPLLGILPYDRSLANPIMESVRHAVRGTVLYNEEYLDNRVENVASGSLIARKEIDDIRNLLIIVSYRRLKEAIEGLIELAERDGYQESPLSGIVVNGEHDYLTDLRVNFPHLDYIREHRIPLVTTQLDTYGAALKISQMEVKINTRTPWKSRRAIELVRDHVSLRGLV